MAFAAGFADPLIFAHLAFAAVEILARAEALILRFVAGLGDVAGGEEPRSLAS